MKEERRCLKCGSIIPAPGQKTNADRIRAMSMEEIAELLDVWPNCNLCQAYYDTCDGPNKDESCKEKLIDWLKQEADNG